MGQDRFDVVGIGNALVDVLASADDALLERFGATKGSMQLIDAEQADKVYAALESPVQISGGSAANTMVGLASFGARSGFIGKVRDDVLGTVFRDDLHAAGVGFETPAATEGDPTGRSMIIVSPDAQRTMQTLLGIAGALGPDDVDEAMIADARITYLEGYLWDPPDAKQAFLKAAKAAHAAERQVALTLSDAFCVERHREEFLALVRGPVDILFANEDEIVSLYEGESFDAVIKTLREEKVHAVVTRGATGSLVVTGGDVVHSVAEKVDPVVDTTGAGDLFAAGYLFGLTRGCPPAECLKLGGVAAAEVISHHGARPERDLAELAEEALGRSV